MRPMTPPFNLFKWIEDNRSLLRPPVGNKLIYEDSEFDIFIVGGPNSRKDYHIDESEEFFYQIEGDITLGVIENGKKRDITIKQGEIFLLPPRVPHAPKRPANTVGLVIERKRREGELDGFQWYCDKCDHLLYEEFLVVKNIVTDLPPIFDRFYSNPQLTTCSKCGHRHAKS